MMSSMTSVYMVHSRQGQTRLLGRLSAGHNRFPSTIVASRSVVIQRARENAANSGGRSRSVVVTSSQSVLQGSSVGTTSMVMGCAFLAPAQSLDRSAITRGPRCRKLSGRPEIWVSMAFRRFLTVPLLMGAAACPCLRSSVGSCPLSSRPCAPRCHIWIMQHIWSMTRLIPVGGDRGRRPIAKAWTKICRCAIYQFHQTRAHP